jgi:hypothetical protein
MIQRFRLAIGLIVCCLCGINCGGPDPKPVIKETEIEKVTALLVAEGASWSLTGSSSVTVDGVDVTDELFKDFSISFEEGSYTTTGTSPVWPRSDTWHFEDESAKVIIRGLDEKEITIENISENELRLKLKWEHTTYEGGRMRSIPGQHVFTLNK